MKKKLIIVSVLLIILTLAAFVYRMVFVRDAIFSQPGWPYSYSYDDERYDAKGCNDQFGEYKSWLTAKSEPVAECGSQAAPRNARVFLYYRPSGSYSEEGIRTTKSEFFKSATVEDVSVGGLAAIKKTVEWAGGSNLIMEGTKTTEYSILMEGNRSYLTVMYWERPGQVPDANLLNTVIQSLRFENTD